MTIVMAPENRRTKEFNVKEWQERIRNGLRFQQRFACSDKWHVYKEYYRHNFGRGKNIIPVNMIFSMLRSLVPQVYFRNPRITVTQRKPGLVAELNARVLQELDNWLLRELMTKQEIKMMIQDSFLTGNGSGFFGYDSEYGFDPTQMGAGGSTAMSLSQFDKKGFKLEYNTGVSPGMPWFLRARPEDVIWPWGTERAANSEWVAMRVFRPLDDVKSDPKYENTSSLQGSFIPIRSKPEGGIMRDPIEETGLESDRPWVELFQIHDARTGKIYALTMDHDKFLRNQSDELQIEGLPVEILSFNPDPDYIYAVPDARIIEPQLLELNEIRSQAMKHRRVDIVKAIVKKGIFTDEEIQKMTDEQVNAIVQAETDQPLSEAIMQISGNVSGILQDLSLAGEIVRGDVRETVGFSRIAQGEFQGKTHVSAEETKRVFQSMNIRLDERRDMVADLLTNIVRRFNQMIFTYWDQERVTKIVGPDGGQWWIKYTGQQIKDEYDVEITPEEGALLDTGSKFEMAMKAAEVWAQLNQGAIAQGVPVPAEIQRLLFSQFKSSGLDIDRFLAQSQALGSQAQAVLGAAGQSSGNAVSPQLLASAMGGK